jgi:putative ABC transport system permease protein
MKLKSLGSETLLSLTTNRSRSALTILGIVVGIAAVIIMVAIGNGTTASIQSQIASVGSNLIFVSPGSGGAAPGQGNASVKTLTVDDATAIRNEVSGVKAVAAVVQGAFEVVAGTNHTNVNVTGTTASYPSVRSVEMADGAWFSDADELAGAKVAVLGPTTSETLFGSGSNPVGQRIRIRGVPFTVAGVTKSKGSTGGDDAAYIPLTTMRRSLSGGNSVNNVYIEAANQDSMATVTQDVKDLLQQRHKIADAKDADFTVTSQKDLANTLSTITGLLTVLLGSIAGISLVVGGIGIMNMMLTSVTERIREIGLRKALGATPRDITSQFLAEAVALTVAGGIIGILLGILIAVTIQVLFNFAATVSVAAVLVAVGVSTAIGVVFGWYPARRAAKLDPIEALRYQ